MRSWRIVVEKATHRVTQNFHGFVSAFVLVERKSKDLCGREQPFRIGRRFWQLVSDSTVHNRSSMIRTVDPRQANSEEYIDLPT